MRVPNPTGKSASAETKDKIIDLVLGGMTAADALRTLGLQRQRLDKYRSYDPEFKRRLDEARTLARKTRVDAVVPDFPVFTETYLGHKLFEHQLQWVDLLNEQAPRNIRPGQVYRAAEPNLIIVNTPPAHAKTTTLSIDYVTWRIVSDPNIRVVIVSKESGLARKILLAIKDRLTHPRYSAMQKAFGPAGGFAGESAGWTQSFIYLSSDQRDSGEKDPTVQSLGLRSHIYGSRADLIILDDVVDLSNAHQFEGQIEWLQSEVLSRPGIGDNVLLIGTRLASQDLYSEIQRGEYYPDGESPWTYFAQPAVIEYKPEPKDWITLWPRSNENPGGKLKGMAADADGLFPKWNGIALEKKRKAMDIRRWAQVYMQAQVDEVSVFPSSVVRSCVKQRELGFHTLGPWRPESGEGLYRVAGLDPAMTGFTGAVCLGVDRNNGKRWVVDVHNESGMTPDGIRNLMKTWTDKYKLNEWRVEKNAFQLMLTQDREIRTYLASRGCILTEHYTGANKMDPDFGVASMAPLFYGADQKANLIELPIPRAESVKSLIEQLCSWTPGMRQQSGRYGYRADLVMALWFAELRARELVDSLWDRDYDDSQFLTERDAENQVVVDLDQLAMESHIAERWIL